MNCISLQNVSVIFFTFLAYMYPYKYKALMFSCSDFCQGLTLFPWPFTGSFKTNFDDSFDKYNQVIIIIFVSITTPSVLINDFYQFRI